MGEGPPQKALFQIEGPDEDGCVWICSPDGTPDVWCQNLGPKDNAADVMSQWLGSIDHDETAQPLRHSLISLSEIKLRLAKRARKAAQPEDHREEGGQG